MALLKYETMWNFINKYISDLDNDLFRDLTCVICGGILQNACQSPCGCRYCYSCIEKYLKEEDKCCPGGTDDCKDRTVSLQSDIVIDYSTNKRISLLKVKCPEKFCEFIGELRKMSEHFASHQLKCPYLEIGCNNPKLSINEMKDHLNNEDYSHTNLMMDFIQNMQNEIDNFKGIEKEKENQIKELNIEIVKIKEDISSMKKEMEKMQNIMEKLEENSENLISSIRGEVVKNNNKINVLKENLLEIKEEQEKLSKDLKKSIENKIKIISDSDNTVNISVEKALEKYFLRQNFSPFKWIIEDYEEKRSDARNKINEILESKAFYSHQNGYKMRLRIYPNGMVNGFNTHLSVGFGIVEGEFDDVLPWPMKLSIKISLMKDCNFNGCHTEFCSDYEKIDQKYQFIFHKPTLLKDPINNFVYISKFINSNSLINNKRVCYNGSICLQCTVSDNSDNISDNSDNISDNSNKNIPEWLK